jgi:methylated-DNA-[protein]-cysteine S-methyltransferase
MIDLLCENFDSPCGPLSIVFDLDDILYHLDFPDQGDRQARLLTRRFKLYNLTPAFSTHIKDAILSYLKGDAVALDRISVQSGGTAFQQSVWRALKTIPYGRTVSYSELAKQIGNPNAIRCVARANALNPLSLIYPCHRVIGKDGTLTGYAGGLARKEWLLRHEGAIS